MEKNESVFHFWIDTIFVVINDYKKYKESLHRHTLEIPTLRKQR